MALKFKPVRTVAFLTLLAHREQNRQRCSVRALLHGGPLPTRRTMVALRSRDVEFVSAVAPSHASVAPQTS